MELLGDDPIEYFNIMAQLPSFSGTTVVPSEYGYVVPFREIIRKEIPRMKYFVNYKGIVYNLSKDRFLIGGLDSSGYRQVTMMGYDGMQYNILVHKLVIEAYGRELPPPNIDDITVDHIDGNKLNNDFRNLRYLSRSENSRHSQHNVISSIPLSVFENISAYYLKHPNTRYSDLGKLFGVDQEIIRRYLLGRTVSLMEVYNKYF